MSSSSCRRDSNGVIPEVVVKGTSDTAVGGLRGQSREIAQIHIVTIPERRLVQDRDIEQATTTEQLSVTFSKEFDHDIQKMSEQKSKAEPCPLKS